MDDTAAGGGVAITASGEQDHVVSADDRGLVTLIRNVLAPITTYKGLTRRRWGGATERTFVAPIERPPFDGRDLRAPATGERPGPRTGGRLASKRG